MASRLRRLQGALSRSTTSLPRRVDALAAAHRAEKAADAQASLGRAAGAAAAAAARAKLARARDAAGAGAGSRVDGVSGALAPWRKSHAVGAAFAEKPPRDVSGSLALTAHHSRVDRARRDEDLGVGPADEATRAAYGALVAEQAEATRRLADILKKDLRDLAVLRRENAGGAVAKTTPQHVPYY